MCVLAHLCVCVCAFVPTCVAVDGTLIHSRQELVLGSTRITLIPHWFPPSWLPQYTQFYLIPINLSCPDCLNTHNFICRDRIRSTILSSRQQTCLHPQVRCKGSAQKRKTLLRQITTPPYCNQRCLKGKEKSKHQCALCVQWKPGWLEPSVGLARTVYIHCVCGTFGREITKYTVIYRVGQNRT